MLVINGVDAQTNSHETGRLFNWTGSNAEGRPSLSALFAASQSPKQPLAYSVFGGFSRTAGLIGYNQFSNLSAARTLVQPYVELGLAIRGARQPTLRARTHGPGGYQSLTGRAQSQRAPASKLAGLHRRARQSRQASASCRLIPDEANVMRGEDVNVGGQNFRLNLKEQMQSALLVFKSGLGSAADLLPRRV